ncbi:ninein-like [Ylistrum balloti]|uniref:ninein-like n=1 Tax=Ylistrum balloti TaxID=509963 RepID=UPI002905CEEB|nr:ninein-like [Ylistrum balloti]
MYMNQLTTRELFSTNPSERHEYPDDNESFSQLQSSQYNDMMTQNSQEAVNSQQFSSGSESQGRRRFLDNYMSGNGNQQSRGNIHPKTLKNDHLRSTVPTKSNFQQQLQLNKARAKERDERDLLNVILKTVKECSEEVKYGIVDLQDILGRTADTTDDKLSDIMSSISQNIQKNYEKMIAAVQERDQKRNQQNILEQEIKQKEERIQELEQQLKDAHERGFRSVVQSVKEVVDQHQAVTKEKLERLSAITTELLDHQKEAIYQQRNGQDQQHRLLLDVQDAVRAQTGTNDKCILDELMMLRQDLENQKYELENIFKDKVCTTQRQTEDLKKFIQAGLEDNVQESINYSKKLYDNHCQQMKENINIQQDNLKGFIDQKFEEKSSENVASLNSGHDEPLWIGKRRFSDYHESVPKKFQDQLDKMHINHIKEIERIRKEINQRNEECQNKKNCEMPIRRSNMLHSQFLESQEKENSKQDKDVNSVEFKHPLISPGNIRLSNWTAKQLFSKSNPSPVATVYPQQKDQDLSHKVFVNDKQTLSSDEQKQVAKPKPRGSAQPQRRSQRLMETRGNSIEETVQNPPNNNNEHKKSQRISSTQNDSQEDGRQGNVSFSNSMSYQQRRQNNPPRIPLQQARQTPQTEATPENRQDPRHDMRQEPQQECNEAMSNKPFVWQCNPGQSYNRKNTSNLLKTNKFNRSPRPNAPVSRALDPQPYSHPTVSQKASVYDFSDKVSVERCHQKPHSTYSTTRSSSYISSRELYGQSNSQNTSSSRESSPSLSVTKIVIQRKVKRDRNGIFNSAAKNQNNTHHYKEYDDDLLSIVGSIKEGEKYSDKPMKSHHQTGNKRPIADYNFGKTYAQTTESIHKRRKNIL